MSVPRPTAATGVTLVIEMEPAAPTLAAAAAAAPPADAAAAAAEAEVPELCKQRGAGQRQSGDASERLEPRTDGPKSLRAGLRPAPSR